MNKQKIRIQDLIAVSELEKMQESFSEVSGVMIRTVDPQGAHLTAYSNVPSLCSEALQDSRVREKICLGCKPNFLGGEGIVDDDLSFECLPGLRNYLVPLKIATSETTSLILGYMIIGPIVFMKRKEKEEFRVIAEELGLDPYQFWSFVLELRVFSYQGIRSLLDMIEGMTGRILALAYSKLSIQRRFSRKIFKRISRKDALPENGFDEFLETFLDLVMDVCNANTASIMLLDPQKHVLTIRAGRGISDEVMRSAKVRLGEGISGLVAQTKRPFLINEGSCDAVISDRLKRPELFSSVVVPIKCRDEVYGVINVSSDRTFHVKYDDSTLALLTKAAGLAGVTLEKISN